MNLKLTTLAVIAAFSSAGTAFASPIEVLECKQNHWCMAPLDVLVDGIGGILLGDGWEVAVNSGFVYVFPVDGWDGSLIVPPYGESGLPYVFDLKVLPNTHVDERIAYQEKIAGFQAQLNPQQAAAQGCEQGLIPVEVITIPFEGDAASNEPSE